jgi:ABC-type transport system involved in Fe-S cluster assembly fused permease/ATPase subunit
MTRGNLIAQHIALMVVRHISLFYCRFIQQSFIDMENVFDLMKEKLEVSE